MSLDAESDRIKEFTEFRQRMNDRILGHDSQVVKRFFALDTQTYKPGALDVKTKELLGLVVGGSAGNRGQGRSHRPLRQATAILPTDRDPDASVFQ